MQGKRLISAIFISFSVFVNLPSAQETTKPTQSIISTKSEQFKDFIEGKTIITAFEITGLDSDYEEYENAIYLNDFLKILNYERANIIAEEKFNTKKIEKILVLLKKWLAGKNFLMAEVTALGEKQPKNRVKIIFSVKREVPIEVSEINFVGNTNISNEEYVADFKQCLQNSWKKFDKRNYEHISQKCSRSLMYSKGYLQGKIVRVIHRVVENNYVVTIEVAEGVRYRIGKIKIVGAKVFSQKKLLDILGQKEGEIADAKAIQNFFFEKLKGIYLDEGYVLYSAEFDVDLIEPQVQGLDGIVNLKGEIDEDRQFKVSKIEFSGVEKENAGELRKQFPLKETEIFNRTKLKDGIKKLNETKEFYFVDDEQDVEIKTDEKNSTVNLFIRVKKIEK